MGYLVTRGPGGNAAYSGTQYANPSAGTRRVCIRTGTGVNDVIKYGLTTNSSASAYCGMRMRVEGGVAYIGRSETRSTTSVSSRVITTSMSVTSNTTVQTTKSSTVSKTTTIRTITSSQSTKSTTISTTNQSGYYTTLTRVSSRSGSMITQSHTISRSTQTTSSTYCKSASQVSGYVSSYVSTSLNTHNTSLTYAAGMSSSKSTTTYNGSGTRFENGFTSYKYSFYTKTSQVSGGAYRNQYITSGFASSITFGEYKMTTSVVATIWSKVYTTSSVSATANSTHTSSYSGTVSTNATSSVSTALDSSIQSTTSVSSSSNVTKTEAVTKSFVTDNFNI